MRLEFFFYDQGHVTLKRIVCSGPNWNSAKILCLSSLSTSLKKIWSKLKVLWCPQHFCRCSRVGNSEVNGRMWPEFTRQRFYGNIGYLQVWWRYKKMRALLCPQHFLHYKSIFGTQGQESSSEILCLSLLSASLKRYDQNWRRYHVHNIFSGVQGQVTPKSIDRCGRNLTSSEFLWLSWLTACLMMIQSKMSVHNIFSIVSIWEKLLWLKGKLLKIEWSNLTRNQTVQDFMPVLVTCKFEEDPIKNDGSIVSTRFSRL